MASTTTTTPTSETPKLLKKGDTKTPTAPTQTTFGCQHIKGLLQQARQQATEQYAKLIASLQKENNVCDRIHKSTSGPASTIQVTYLCLQCPWVSMLRERHLPKHSFSVESSNGFIFCHDCRDFVYDPTFEEIRSGNSKKRKYSSTLLESDKKLVFANATTAPCAATGLRGLYNMGQTCFMSVILQSLIHNPLIRTFYLCEGHKSSDCEREACTACALDDIFSDFFAHEKHEGYGAVHMLQSCWKGGGGLAGYSQQDAHEYLNFILNSLHEAIAEDEKQDSKNCSCVIHQTFGGLYKSTVTCTTCNNTTTAQDPFIDLSLDIKSTGFAVKKKKLAMINGTQTVKEALPMDLSECLDRYTSTETLPSDSYHCRKCDVAREAKKKLTLTRLPPVIPIHLKRFSHSKASSQSSKVDTRVRFPLTLDLSIYAAPSPATTEEDSLKPGKDDDDENIIDAKALKKAGTLKESSVTEPPEAVYQLSSVVVHKGKLDNGHYISYSQQSGEWFRFDDSMVVQVNEREVLSAEAYMLFYVVEDI